MPRPGCGLARCSRPKAYTLDPQWIRNTHGEAPPETLAESRALQWAPRAYDPNAGRSPVDKFEHEPSDYIQPLLRDAAGKYQFHDWAAALGPNCQSARNVDP